MATEAETRKQLAHIREQVRRRHPLQVTAARLRDAVRDYPQVFDPPSRAVAEALAAQFDRAVEGGVLEAAPITTATNPGQPYDQRQASEQPTVSSGHGLGLTSRSSK